jgi:putative alpha-1,2-mannosidase
MRTKKLKTQAKAPAMRTPEVKPQLNCTPKPTNSTALKSESRKTTPATPSTTSKARKSPAAHASQPAELSEEYRTRLREFLDHTDHPFAVHTVPLSRKRKRNNANQLQLQNDLFQERLTVQYEVKPRDKWESLRRYKKFTGKEDQPTKRAQ